MLIETSIKGRRDGTVNVKAPSGAVVLFVPVDGRLVADVDEPGDLAFLLALGDFFPADEADHAQAEEVLRSETGANDLPDDDGDEDAAPIEVTTPPRPARPGRPRK